MSYTKFVFLYFLVPEIVGSVKVEKSDSQTAQVTWSKSSTPISNYEVKYMDTKGTIFDNIITSSEAYILEELAPSTEYIVQVTLHIKNHFPKKSV